MSNEDGLKQEKVLRNEGPVSIPSYSPPPQFKLINTPPLLHEVPDNAELWLVRIQDSQLGADDFMGKRVKLALNALDGRMGCFKNFKGSQFEFVDLHDVAGVQPFAFLPKGDSSLEVCRVSRQVAIVQNLDPVILSRPYPEVDQDVACQADGDARVQIKREESHAGSASISMGVGGISTVESLQDDEERISTGKLGKSGKKSKREQPNTELDLSPGPSHKDLEVEEGTPSNKKSRKHKKIK
eukprot:c10147_g1_i1 orf=126-848(+)